MPEGRRAPSGVWQMPNGWFRQPNGVVVDYRTAVARPTEAQRDAGALTVDWKRLEAYCPVCNTWYAIPSELVAIQRDGICASCDLFFDGRLAHIYYHPTLTVADVLQIQGWGYELTTHEQGILADALRELLNGGE